MTDNPLGNQIKRIYKRPPKYQDVWKEEEEAGKDKNLCLWKQCYFDSQKGKGTTAINWNEYHPCAICDGKKKDCDRYIKVDSEDLECDI